VAAAADDTTAGAAHADESDSQYILEREYWANKNGEITLENAELDEWEVFVYETDQNKNQIGIQSSQRADDIDILRPVKSPIAHPDLWAGPTGQLKWVFRSTRLRCPQKLI
jgi:hypothetical protein